MMMPSLPEAYRVVPRFLDALRLTLAGLFLFVGTGARGHGRPNVMGYPTTLNG